MLNMSSKQRKILKQSERKYYHYHHFFCKQENKYQVPQIQENNIWFWSPSTHSSDTHILKVFVLFYLYTICAYEIADVFVGRGAGWPGSWTLCVQVTWVLGHHHYGGGMWQVGGSRVYKPTALLPGSLWPQALHCGSESGDVSPLPLSGFLMVWELPQLGEGPRFSGTNATAVPLTSARP